MCCLTFFSDISPSDDCFLFVMSSECSVSSLPYTHHTITVRTVIMYINKPFFLFTYKRFVISYYKQKLLKLLALPEISMYVINQSSRSHGGGAHMVPYKKKQLNGIFHLMIASAYISVFKKSKFASF